MKDFFYSFIIGFTITGLASGCSCTQSIPPKEHARAQRYMKHQHLMVKAIREIVNEDVSKDCQSLTEDECGQVRKDQAEMIEIMHEASKPFDAEGY